MARALRPVTRVWPVLPQGTSRGHPLRPARLLRRAGLRARMRVADVGCGTGAFTVPAAVIVGPVGRVYAVDISEDLLRTLRERVDAQGLRQIATVAATPAAIPLPDVFVDLAILAFVLHEAADPVALAREVARILIPAGRVLLLEWEKRETPAGPPVRDRLTPEGSEVVLRDAGFITIDRFAPGADRYGILAVREPLVLGRPVPRDLDVV
ncbi:MAG: methyltransferase domain-containing protein [Armatimonadota bacterium]|nr:methyltransferase domain-containing protein [Armatimonadota bacterium]